MSVLSGKKIVLGVSGGIAAYKTATLVRLFIKAGAHVQVIMTPASKDFVTPLTLSTLSKNPVHSSATYLSAKCPVYFAPAMDLDMYKHPSTIASFNALQNFGNTIIPAESGELASGLSGEGRMAEPENIVTFIEADLESKLPLKGKKILITAGPTYEAIDPVRFIGNHSSGKMGFDIANCAANLGAEVILVSGPTHFKVKNDFINLVRVVSAQEMYDACHQYYNGVDVAIAAAAVADYRPKVVADQKIKKSDTCFSIELEKTKDILASLGEIKKNQFLIGFALETENEVENAKLKIQKKNLDLIVLNSLQDEGAGFGKPTNKITFIDSNFTIEPMDLKSKEDVAQDIINKVIEHYHA
jgi:phosphopantothenoylcysteine decarboxylase/phosphopantothenate--cysteine ligase